jgi:PAS domain S-box-containing protein
MKEFLKKIIEDSAVGITKLKRDLTVVYLLTILLHVIFWMFFSKKGIVEMKIFNYISPFLYIGCLYLNIKDKITLAALLALAETFIHATLSTIYVGWDCGFYYYLLLGYLLIFFVFDFKTVGKFLLSAALTSTIIGLYLLSIFQPPKYTLLNIEIKYIYLGNLFLFLIVLSAFALFYTYFLTIMKRELDASFKQMEESQISLLWQIDETKSIHNQLLKENALMNALMNNLPDYIYFKDRESRFIRISQSMQKLFKVDIDEMLGKTDFDFQRKEAAQKYRKDEQQIIETRKGLINDIVYEQFPTGIKQWVTTTKLPLIDTNNNCIGTFGITKDITYIKQLEIAAQKQAAELRKHQEQLQKKEEEQRLLNQQKNKFFSVFAHDLNNPLNALMGFTHLLADKYDGYSEEKRKKIIGNLVLITGNLQSLIGNLLDWSRSQLNSLSILPETHALRPIVENVILLYSVQQSQKHISTIINIDDSIQIFADTNIIQTVFRNLYSNAIKFTHPGGKIEITGRKTPDGIEIAFADNGIGMSPEIKNKLFSLGNTTSQMGTLNEKGSGLGLIVCQEYLARSNGFLTVDSELDKGSTFTVHFSRTENID